MGRFSWNETEFKTSFLNLESKQILLEIESGLEKVVIAKACNFITKETLLRCFPVNFAKFLRTPFFVEYPWWLLL